MRELSINREQICKNCPIFSPINNRCNPKLWVNPNTNEVSTFAKPGFIRGCGCYLEMKWKSQNSHCIAGKW